MAATLIKPEALSAESAAAVVDCHPKTIRRAIARGELKSFRIGRGRIRRIWRRDLDAWAESRSTGGTASTQENPK